MNKRRLYLSFLSDIFLIANIYRGFDHVYLPLASSSDKVNGVVFHLYLQFVANNMRQMNILAPNIKNCLKF